MAKISPTSIKYNIKATFEAEGPLEKPDVIGALFGQTEGLLGSDMELRELQQEGKIGRIEVEITREDGKTKGKILIPSALDKTETAIIGAAIETIDKIGPTEAKIKVEEVEDVRGNKRDYIMQRAKELLLSINDSSLETQEIEQELKEKTRTSKIQLYGEEQLPAGDLSEDEIIVVEGRADVVNLLKHNITNVIGMNGTKLPKEIKKLGETKTLTLFVDGDRGGELIAKNVCENARISYIAQAPDGKEVEELTGKEIHQALRKKTSVEEFFGSSRSSFLYGEKLSEEDKEKLRKFLNNLEKNIILILNKELIVIKKLSKTNPKIFNLEEKPYIILTEKADKKTIKLGEKIGAKFLIAKTFENLIETNVELISL